MKAKIFSYKVAGIKLESVDDNLQISQDFDRKQITEELKSILKEQNFKLDEHSLDYKIVDGQLFIEGLAVEKQETKSIGFITSK